MKKLIVFLFELPYYAIACIFLPLYLLYEWAQR